MRVCYHHHHHHHHHYHHHQHHYYYYHYYYYYYLEHSFNVERGQNVHAVWKSKWPIVSWL